MGYLSSLYLYIYIYVSSVVNPRKSQICVCMCAFVCERVCEFVFTTLVRQY